MITFRKFIAEQEAAPPMGAGPAAAPPAGMGAGAPPSPDNTKYNSRIGDRELGISKKDRKDIDEHGEELISWSPFEWKSHGIKASGPIPIEILEKFPNGDAKVKVMYTQTNPEKLQNINGSEYKGPIEDKEAYFTREILDNIRLNMLKQGGAGAAPPGGMPGGDMAGGIPPVPGGM